VNDLKIYRITGACTLVSIGVFFIEFPMYFLRGPFPSMAEPFKLGDFAARNATNIMTCVLFDLVILSLILVFLAGFRHLIRQTQPQQEWLGTLAFGVGVVYTTLTLIADSLQGATVLDALAGNADSSAIRAMMESMYLMYGSVALFLMALLMAVAGYATVASRALPKWSGWVGYACAVVLSRICPVHVRRQGRSHRLLQPCWLGSHWCCGGVPAGHFDDRRRHSHDAEAGTCLAVSDSTSVGDQGCEYSIYSK